MVISVLVWFFLISALTVSAQAMATPMTLGENKTGSIADASSSALYSIQVDAPQSVTVLVLAVSPNFAPTFRVLDSGGVVIVETVNASTETIAQASPTLSSPGTYTIEVRSANNSTGQFLLSIQPGAPLTPPQPLVAGQPINGSLNQQTTRQAYSFSGSDTDVLLLTVSMGDSAGAVIALRDADSDETLSLSSARLGGIRYRILVGQANYLLEVTHSGASSAEAFNVCLATESGSATCPGDSASTTVVEATVAPTLIAGVPSQTPTFAPVAINPADACQVTPARNNSVNVRSGAGTNFNIVGQIAANGTGLVVGRLADNSWFQVNVNGAPGWVSAGVVIPGGNCSGVAVIVLPTAIPPTNAPPVSVPTNTSGNPPPTEAPAEVPPDMPKLDAHADTEYVVNLQGQGTIVFFDYAVASIGADVDASYLGSGCAGLVSAAPTLYITLTDPLPGLLRFFFVHNDATDPVMIIQDPDGHIHCGDDSYGTVNPTIDLNGPSGGFPRTSPPRAGRYYIWIGSHSIPTIGTLYVTNSEDYHP